MSLVEEPKKLNTADNSSHLIKATFDMMKTSNCGNIFGTSRSIASLARLSIIIEDNLKVHGW